MSGIRKEEILKRGKEIDHAAQLAALDLEVGKWRQEAISSKALYRRRTLVLCVVRKIHGEVGTALHRWWATMIRHKETGRLHAVQRKAQATLVDNTKGNAMRMLKFSCYRP